MKKTRYFYTGIAAGVGIVLAIQLVVFGFTSFDEIFADNYSPLNLFQNHVEYENENYAEFEDKVEDVLQHLDTYYYEDVDDDALFEEALRGLVDSVGDPYTTYFTAEEYSSFIEKMEGSYEGIGVVISYGETEDEVIVVAPFKESPGEKAGLRPEDRIVGVDGVDVIGMSLDKIVELIKGEKGTEVVLSILRNDEEMEIPIIRDVIEVHTIEYEMLENSIGYIQMSGFDIITEEQFELALEDLNNQNQQGLIIDLRNNPGGYLHIVYAILDELLEEDKLVVYTEDKYGNRDELITETLDSFDKPLVVLINGNSASASEILAGAIKDHGKGVIVGETSFGKGLVQQTFKLADGSAVKITISRYYTPSGNYIHEVGVEPDVLVEYDADSEEDNQLNKAIEVIENAIQEK